MSARDTTNQTRSRSSSVAVDPHHFQIRLFEIIPGAMTWITLLGLSVLAFIVPAWVAIFIIVYDLYWLVRAVYISAHLISSYKNLWRHKGINWMERLRMIENPEESLRIIRDRIYDKKSIKLRKKRKDLVRELWQLQQAETEFEQLCKSKEHILSWEKIRHLVILPTYNEPFEVLRQSLNALSKSDFPLHQIWVVIGLEERAGKEHTESIQRNIEQHYKDTFGRLSVIIHPDGIAGEKKVKSANATWAAKEMKNIIDKEKIPYEHIVVSNFDADTCVRPDYFSYLTYVYSITPDRTRCSYQPLPVFHNNIWNAPAFTRVIATNSSFWQMIESTRSYRMITFSSHSMSFSALVDVGFWQVDVVSEDSRIFWQCYTHYNSNYRTVPLFTNISMDAVQGPNMWRTFLNQYKQKRRWAWGIENFPYMAHEFMHRKEIPFSKKFAFLFRILEGNHSWATSAIIIAGLAWLPVFFGGAEFHMTVLAYNLPRVTRTIMTGAMFGLIIVMTISLLLLPPAPPGTPKRKYVYMVLQWALVPVIASVLGSMPAIDAQTRLMLGRPLGFWATTKVRSQDNRESPS